ncbi:hypothetical protein, partial [Komagataeibacter europaeus]|uniref:hypothetical protein n=1 Tax=Komagataeibacter europaeus TaxID=33995 RepID=UPI0019553F60
FLMKNPGQFSVKINTPGVCKPVRFGFRCGRTDFRVGQHVDSSLTRSPAFSCPLRAHKRTEQRETK